MGTITVNNNIQNMLTAIIKVITYSWKWNGHKESAIVYMLLKQYLMSMENNIPCNISLKINNTNIVFIKTIHIWIYITQLINS